MRNLQKRFLVVQYLGIDPRLFSVKHGSEDFVARNMVAIIAAENAFCRPIKAGRQVAQMRHLCTAGFALAIPVSFGLGSS
jgi:hypothetical protein